MFEGNLYKTYYPIGSIDEKNVFFYRNGAAIKNRINKIQFRYEYLLMQGYKFEQDELDAFARIKDKFSFDLSTDSTIISIEDTNLFLKYDNAYHKHEMRYFLTAMAKVFGLLCVLTVISMLAQYI